MSAPRKYSDAQRAAMFALYEQGLNAVEIAQRCADGMASVGPFQVPRRTVHEIVSKMARERGHQPPKTIDEASQLGALERYPRDALGVVHRELKRIDRKQNNGKPLNKHDCDVLLAGAKLVTAIWRLPNGSGARSKSPTAHGTAPNGNGSNERPNMIEALRRAHEQGIEPGETHRGRKETSQTHTRPEVSSTPPERQPHRVNQEPAEAPAIEELTEDSTAEECKAAVQAMVERAS